VFSSEGTAGGIGLAKRGSRSDTLDFNGAGVDEKMSLSPIGERSLFVRDVATIRMDMDGVEQLDLTALGGADTVTVDDMTGTDLQQADIDLSAPTGGGDGQPDAVTVNAALDLVGVAVDLACDSSDPRHLRRRWAGPRAGGPARPRPPAVAGRVSPAARPGRRVRWRCR